MIDDEPTLFERKPTVFRLFAYKGEKTRSYGTGRREVLEKYSSDSQQENYLSRIEDSLSEKIRSVENTDTRLHGFLGELNELVSGETTKQELLDYFTRFANIVVSTCVGLGGKHAYKFTDEGFDWVIIEEAAKAHLPEILVPMVYGDKWLLVGDHKQLPPFNYAGLPVDFQQVGIDFKEDFLERLVPDLKLHILSLENEIKKLLKALLKTNTYVKMAERLASDEAFWDQDMQEKDLPKIYTIEAAINNSANLWWPHSESPYDVCVILHSLPISMYKTLKNMKQIVKNPYNLDLLLSDENGILNTLELLTESKKSLKKKLKKKKYFKEAIASNSFISAFANFTSLKEEIEGCTKKLENSKKEYDDKQRNIEARAKRIYHYFAYTFDKINKDETDGVDENVTQYASRLGRAMIPTQYRMHPAIRKVVSRLFYEEELATAILDPYENEPEKYDEWLKSKKHGLGGTLENIHLAWINAEGKCQEVPKWPTLYNLYEADWIVFKLLPELCEALYEIGKLESTTVAILSGYRGQVKLLHGELPLKDTKKYQNKLDELKNRGLNFVIETVDSFQGQEADIVVVSMTTTRRGHFFRDIVKEKKGDNLTKHRVDEARNRLNVLLSRAKQLLIIVGHKEIFYETNIRMRQLINIMEETKERHYKIFEAKDDIHF